MRLKNAEPEAAPRLAQDEPRYDADTLRKVAVLAQQLQNRQQKTLTAREIEEIGAEVGLDPAFMRMALEHVTRCETRPCPPKRVDLLAEVGGAVKKAGDSVRSWDGKTWKTVRKTWWAAGWTFPFIGVSASMMHGDAGPMGFFIGWAVYIGGGILLSQRARDAAEAPASFSRATMIQTLFELQRELDSHKQHRAFLSVDVVGSSEIKRSAPELAVEYTFGEFRRWIEQVARAHGGEVASAAGDGMMCSFLTNEQAVRAARQIQEQMPRWSAAHNRLGAPFQIRCGASAGAVAIEAGTPLGYVQSPVIDQAAVLQKLAPPGGLLVSGELFAAAQAELCDLSLLPEPVGGQPIFAWSPTPGC